MTVTLRAPMLALCAAAAVGNAGCTTDFGPKDADGDAADTGTDAVDPGIDTAPDADDPGHDTAIDPPIDTAVDDDTTESTGICGDGTVQGGEECEGAMTSVCTTECGMEGYMTCVPSSCTWVTPCRTYEEACFNGCDDDFDGKADCADDECATMTGCSCTMDGMEPNDTTAGAKLLTAGTYSGLSICLGNEDYYRFAVVLPTTAVVQVLFTNAEGDIDLALYDSSGGAIGTSTSPDDDETVTASLPALGQYYVKVYLYDDLGTQAGNDYTLILTY